MCVAVRQAQQVKIGFRFRPVLHIVSAMASNDPLQCSWEEHVKTTEIQIMTCLGCEPRRAIAAFDLDNTIIATKSGRVFPTNFNDWRLLFEPQVQQTLKRLYYEEDYKIVVITNQ